MGTEKLMPISSNEDILLLSDRYTIIHPTSTYKYSLELNNANEKDSGTFRCRVVFGEDQKIDADVPFLVLEPAYFSDDTTKTIRVSEGDAISIDCQPGGSPKPEVYWERLGDELPFYGGQFFKANQLELPLIDRTHVGHYICYADNSLANPATSEVIIEVEYKPTITVKNKNVAASVFDQVELDINTGFEDTNGMIVSKLNINQVQVEDFSEYFCVAENSVGSIEESIRVEMKTPPVIEKQTKGEKIYELFEDGLRGRNELPIALECVSSGVPTPTYRWTKNGEPLLWQSDPRMTLEIGTGTLLITNPGIKDNGKYQCFAYNELGVAASEEILLSNNTMIDFIREEPGNVNFTAEIGRPFRFACPKVVGHPKPELTWMKARDKDGGVEMEYINNERMVIDEAGTLWISHVTGEDDSEANGFKYVCLAQSDLFPQDISLAKTIRLKTIKPEDGRINIENENINIESFLMHSSSKEVTFKSNQENRLWCIFGGEPVPQVMWQRTDKKEISDTRYYVQNFGQTLVLKDTQLEDAGEYECLASNGVGKNKSYKIRVNVDVVPKFKKEFDSQAQVVQEGTTVSLSCEILEAAAANPTYEWFFNSAPIKIVPGSKREIQGSTLIIKSTTVADIGNYACKASNDVGYAYGQTALSIIPRSPGVMAPVSLEVNKAIEGINKRIDSLSIQIQDLKSVVQDQVNQEAYKEEINALLNRIADKLLAEEIKIPADDTKKPADDTKPAETMS
ncbi:Neuroglian [Armadillidium vulgare]|nr:Neuroglian [Armadillidium vulgare]